MKNIIALLLFSLFTAIVQAQPSIIWQTVYGEVAEDEQAEAVIEMPNGGYAVAGYSGNPSNYNYLITRINSVHEIVWQTIIGGIDVEKAYDLVATEDNGVVVTGSSLSNDGDVGLNNGGVDAWVVKLSDEGEIVWSRVLGGAGEDFFRGITELPDGTFLITGHSDSANGDFTENLGNKDLWVVKLSSEGEVVWKHNYGGSGNDSGSDITFDAQQQQIVVIGSTSSADGDVSLNKGSRDIWLIRLNMEGTLLWEKTYGGSLGDFGTSLSLTPDGGVAFISDIISNDGDITQYFGQGDIWMVRVDSTGALLWQRTIGLSALDNGRGIIYDPVSGNVYGLGLNYDPTVSPPNYIWDIYFIKLDGNNGSVIYTQRFGGSLYDFGNSMIRNSAGNNVIAGYTDSTDGDLGGGYRQEQPVHGNHDVWVFEVDEFNVGIEEGQAVTDYSALAFIPSLRAIQITLPFQPTTSGALVITDLYGRVVSKSDTAQNQLISLPGNLPAGLYLATLYLDNHRFAIKLMLP